MASIRIGFVGVGRMGQMAHLRNYVTVEGCQVVALAEIRPKMRQLVAQRYGVPSVYADHVEMLAAEELDGVVVSQPFSRHAVLLPDIYPKVARVFTEKPLAVSVAAGASGNVSMEITAYTPHGAHPFAVLAAAQAGQANRKADAVLLILGDRRVEIDIQPATQQGGPGATTLYTVTVTNAGQMPDTYDLAVNVRAGWTHQLEANGEPVSRLVLSPYLFHSANLNLIVTPDTGAAPATYGVQVIAQSQTYPAVSASAAAGLDVTGYGVQVEIQPSSTTLSPGDDGIWAVQVTNTGSQADTYDLTPAGIVALSGLFSSDSVPLAAGQQSTVQLTAADLTFALPTTYPIAVAARSRAKPGILGYDRAEVTFSGYEDVALALDPVLNTLSDSTTARYLLFVTNTGNINTRYTLAGTSEPGELALEIEPNEVYIPPHMTAGLLLTAKASANGMFTITVRADSTTSPVAGEAQAALVVESIPEPILHLTKTVEPLHQLPGLPVTYTVVVGNSGDEAASVIVSDVLPAEVEFDRTDSGGTYYSETHQLVWGPLALGAQSVVTATTVVTIGAQVTPSTWLTNTAYLYHQGTKHLQAEAAHQVQAWCVPLQGVQLTRLGQGAIYTDTVVEFSADVAPEDADKPYNYRLEVDAAPVLLDTSSADPLVFTQTFAALGSHTVGIAVWNCDMDAADAMTATLGVDVSRVFDYYYVPIILKNTNP